MRLFVAIDIPAETREALASLIAGLKPKCPSARWVRPEAMHITLKFIGHTAPENLSAIRDALAKARSAKPIEMHFRSLGFFPNEKRPRVFWCGVQASSSAATLAADLDHGLSKLGIASETRPFTPHLTLARFKEGDDRGEQSGCAVEIANVARETQATDFGSLRASEFHLFESTTKPTSAEYTKLSTFHFTEAAS
jgi:2'-5' RNA ligase